MQQQEAGVEDPASQPVRRGCDPDRNGTDAPDVVGGTVGPARPERSGHSTGAEGFGIPPRHWRRASDRERTEWIHRCGVGEERLGSATEFFIFQPFFLKNIHK